MMTIVFGGMASAGSAAEMRCTSDKAGFPSDDIREQM